MHVGASIKRSSAMADVPSFRLHVIWYS